MNTLLFNIGKYIVDGWNQFHFMPKKRFAQEQIIYNLVVHALISEIKMWWSQAEFFPSTWRLVNDFYRSIIGSWNGNFQKKKSKRILRGYKKNVKNCKSAFQIMTRLSFFYNLFIRTKMVYSLTEPYFFSKVGNQAVILKINIFIQPNIIF